MTPVSTKDAKPELFEVSPGLTSEETITELTVTETEEGTTPSILTPSTALETVRNLLYLYLFNIV